MNALLIQLIEVLNLIEWNAWSIIWIMKQNISLSVRLWSTFS